MTNIKAWEIIHYGLMGCMEAELVCLRHHPIRNKCNCSVLILYLNLEWCYSSDVTVQFGHSVMSNSLWPHGLQHTRLPCPSPTPGGCSNSCPLSRWCHQTISSSVAPFSIFPSIRVFSNESAVYIRWPKYWSFSFIISPSNEYSRLISFRTDWMDLLAVQRTLNVTELSVKWLYVQIQIQ